MTKARVALFGSAMTGMLLCGAGWAQAQDYRYDSPSYYDHETIIVHPDYANRLHQEQLVGRVNGEVDPTRFSLSQRVHIGDLDLSRPADRMELRDRVHATARHLCAELNARVPELRGDISADRECVRTAMNDAMDQAYYGRG